MPVLGIGGRVKCFLSELPWGRYPSPVYKTGILVYITRAGSFEEIVFDYRG